jgi:uncharacterized lipoprotein YehR (DUF1307 family)
MRMMMKATKVVVVAVAVAVVVVSCANKSNTKNLRGINMAINKFGVYIHGRYVASASYPNSPSNTVC